MAEPKPVYAQPGQPDVDLPVSPSDAPVPSAAHDDSILRQVSWMQKHFIVYYYLIIIAK